MKRPLNRTTMPIDLSEVTQAYELHQHELRSFFRTFARRKDNVDDLVQEVYVELIRFPPREAIRDPAAYLYKVAWHLLQRTNKRARRDPVTHDHATLDQISGSFSDDAAAELTAEQHIVNLLKELPPMYGAVLILNRRDGMSYEQIANRLNISVSKVRRYLGLTLSHLKKAQDEA